MLFLSAGKTKGPGFVGGFNPFFQSLRMERLYSLHIFNIRLVLLCCQRVRSACSSLLIVSRQRAHAGTVGQGRAANRIGTLSAFLYYNIRRSIGLHHLLQDGDGRRLVMLRKLTLLLVLLGILATLPGCIVAPAGYYGRGYYSEPYPYYYGPYLYAPFYFNGHYWVDFGHGHGGRR
jgi:hypothetical protein